MGKGGGRGLSRWVESRARGGRWISHLSARGFPSVHTYLSNCLHFVPKVFVLTGQTAYALFPKCLYSVGRAMEAGFGMSREGEGRKGRGRKGLFAVCDEQRGRRVGGMVMVFYRYFGFSE